MKTLGNILWHFPFFGFLTEFADELKKQRAKDRVSKMVTD
jgi:hypothetical protein